VGLSEPIGDRQPTRELIRLRQGISALWARRRQASLPDRYKHALPNDVIMAWSRLAPYDQHHLLAVSADLQRGGATDQVIVAGLLHDIGKAGGVSLVDRVACVLLGRFLPGTLRRLKRPPPGLNGLHLLTRHAEEGARLLERAGMPPEVVWLVRHHEAALDDPALRALQVADRRN
jgi:hypothetical protein